MLSNSAPYLAFIQRYFKIFLSQLFNSILTESFGIFERFNLPSRDQCGILLCSILCSKTSRSNDEISWPWNRHHIIQWNIIWLKNYIIRYWLIHPCIYFLIIRNLNWTNFHEIINKLDESTARRQLKSPQSLSGRSIHLTLVTKWSWSWSWMTHCHLLCAMSIGPPILRYSYFKIWPWKSMVKVMCVVKAQGHI